jgi:hypothetical protein
LFCFFCLFVGFLVCLILRTSEGMLLYDIQVPCGFLNWSDSEILSSLDSLVFSRIITCLCYRPLTHSSMASLLPASLFHQSLKTIAELRVQSHYPLKHSLTLYRLS